MFFLSASADGTSPSSPKEMTTQGVSGSRPGNSAKGL